MSKNPTIQIDNFNVLNELERAKNVSQKIVIQKFEQGAEVFQNYSFNDAIVELEKLFDC
ncbi:MAG: hypothetical protein ACTSW1_06000 [Candidatus Hodarchaeales archaeon]